MINTKIAAFGTHIGLCTIVYTKEDKYRAGFGTDPKQAETDRVSRGQKTMGSENWDKENHYFPEGIGNIIYRANS